jgi:hypothetical protein
MYLTGKSRKMLIEFSVRNFRSFADKQTFHLVAGHSDESLQNNIIQRTTPGAAKTNFLSSAVLYGANNVGKTNLFQALAAMSDFIINSFRAGTASQLCAEPFKFQQQYLGYPSDFEIHFIADNIYYEYFLAVTTERVVNEYLYAYPKGVAQRWFSREWRTEKNEYNWHFPNKEIKKLIKDFVDWTRPNVAFLSVAGYLDTCLKPVFDWFAQTLQFVNFGDYDLTPAVTVERFKMHSGRIIQLLRDADFKITDVKVSQSGDDVTAFVYEGDFEISWDYESSGLKRYFSLLGYFLNALDNGQVLFVNELDTSLHPILVTTIVKWFNSTLKTNYAQLIFTTHNLMIMDNTIMRRDQIWFADKKNNATQLYFLSEFEPEEKEEKEDRVKYYLEGRVGGIPHISLDFELRNE